MKNEQHLNCVEIWDAIEKTFLNLSLEEVATMDSIVVKAIELGESYMLIRLEDTKKASSRDVEVISVSGHVNKTMQVVENMAYEDGVDCWKEKKRRHHSVWCFKMHWDEEE